MHCISDQKIKYIDFFRARTKWNSSCRYSIAEQGTVVRIGALVRKPLKGACEQSKCLTRSWEILSNTLLEAQKKYLQRSKGMWFPEGRKISCHLDKKALDNVREESDPLWLPQKIREWKEKGKQLHRCARQHTFREKEKTLFSSWALRWHSGYPPARKMRQRKRKCRWVRLEAARGFNLVFSHTPTRCICSLSIFNRWTQVQSSQATCPGLISKPGKVSPPLTRWLGHWGACGPPV